MAKLNGVQTIGMVNGEITAIKYDGAVYAKVDGDSKVGDVMLRVAHEIGGVVSVGHFYVQIIGDPRYGNIDEVWYETHDGREVRGNSKYFVAFRKASETPQASAPFAEMVVSRVEAVERKVAAIEAKLTSAIPKPKTGDIVVITANTNSSQNKVGDIGKVVRSYFLRR